MDPAGHPRFANNSDLRVRTAPAPHRWLAAQGTMVKLLHTVTEAAETLGVSPRTIYRLLTAGDLVAIKVRSATRIPEESLQRFVAERTRRARRDGWGEPW